MESIWIKNGMQPLGVMNIMTNEWQDEVTEGAKNVKHYLDYVLRERAQLYGTVIFLMISNGLTEVELPSPETFKRYGYDYYIQYEKATDRDDLFRFKLVEREEPDESESQS